MGIPFALQLYTVRDHMDADPEGTLRRVKEIGYDYVELAGFAGRTSEQFKHVLDACGLKATGAHVGYGDLVERPAEMVALAKRFGIDYVIVPWLGGETCPDAEAWVKCARAMGGAGALLRQAGVALCYHNHAHEFAPIEGRRPFDIVFSETRPEDLAAELDVYWLRYGGQDPLATIQAFRGRCPLLHIKDMADTPAREFAEVGRGVIDWKPIVAAGKAAGTKWFVVEQDLCPGDSLESAAISAEYMRGL